MLELMVFLLIMPSTRLLYILLGFYIATLSCQSQRSYSPSFPLSMVSIACHAEHCGVIPVSTLNVGVIPVALPNLVVIPDAMHSIGVIPDAMLTIGVIPDAMLDADAYPRLNCPM